MRQSKYVNKQFGKWTCTAIFLAANYSGSTRHNAYRYQLQRPTSDGKFTKSITVSGSTMKRIANGTISADEVAINKKKLTPTAMSEVLYRFNH